MTYTDQLIWEDKADTQTKAIIFLLNLYNKIAKKDLHLAFAQGNHSAYQETIESMTKFLLLQYNIKAVNIPRNKKGDKARRKVMKPNLKLRISTRWAPQVL